MYHDGDLPVQSMYITNRICDFDTVDRILEYAENYFSNHKMSLKCAACKEYYELSSGEIIFFNSKGFTLPRRCKPCRKLRKQNKLKEND